MSYHLNQYTLLQTVIILAIVGISIDSLMESSLLQYLSETDVYLPPSLRPSHGVTSQNRADGTNASEQGQQAARYTQVRISTLEDDAFEPLEIQFSDTRQLPIDHNDSQAGFFSNRYWVNDEFYRPGGPVFVHDSGESDAGAAARRYLFTSGSYLQTLLQEFHGIGIVWEHRYYGESCPFPINTETGFGQFRGLTFEQALADLPHFARNFSLSELPRIDATPSGTPWVILGCSYSGLRTAASRLLYPDTFFAAYAASAPVQLQVELDEFFDAMYDKMMDRGYTSCVTRLHSIVMYIDQLLSAPDSAVSVKQSLLGPGAELNSNGDFALAIANIFSYFQSYGITRGPHSLGSLCTHLESHTNFSDIQFRDQELFEAFASWPDLRKIVNDHFNTSCRMEHSSSTSCDLAQVNTNADSISWTWQLCSELGLFVTQNPGPSSLVSRFMSLEWRMDLCKRQFPHIYAQRILREIPQVDEINRKTGGRLMRPTNTFWTAGQYDPWRALTTLSRNGSAHDDLFRHTQRIPEKNTSTGPETVFGYVLKDAQHCYDWSLEYAEAQYAQDLFSRALRKWLAD